MVRWRMAVILIACVLAACTPDDSESSGAVADDVVADAEGSVADDSTPAVVPSTLPSPPTIDPRA